MVLTHPTERKVARCISVHTFSVVLTLQADSSRPGKAYSSVLNDKRSQRSNKCKEGQLNASENIS